MVAQVVAAQPFDGLVVFDADAAPFGVDDVGEDGELLPCLDVVVSPIVSQLVARFLPGHALGNPLVAAAVLLPGLAGTVKGQGGVSHFLHALVADLGQPEFDGFGSGAGD